MRPLRVKQALVMLAAALSVDVLPSEASVRGASPQRAGAYATALSRGSFQCMNGTGKLPATAINDNYCDCADGSDEPGAPTAILPLCSPVHTAGVRLQMSLSHLLHWAASAAPAAETIPPQFLQTDCIAVVLLKAAVAARKMVRHHTVWAARWQAPRHAPAGRSSAGTEATSRGRSAPLLWTTASAVRCRLCVGDHTSCLHQAATAPLPPFFGHRAAGT